MPAAAQASRAAGGSEVDDFAAETMEAMEIEILDERVTRDGEQSFVLGISSVRRLGACLVVLAAILAFVGMALEHDVSLEDTLLNKQDARLNAQRKELVQKQAMDFIDSQRKEAKLVKMLTIMQNIFARESRGMGDLGELEGEFGADIATHDARIDKLVQKLKGDPKVVKYLDTELHKASRELHDTAHNLVLGLGRSIAIEQQNADGWLHGATRDVVTELNSELHASASLAEASNKDVKAAVQRLKTTAPGATGSSSAADDARQQTQDEADLASMVNNFASNLIVAQHRARASPAKLSVFELAGAQRIVDAVAGVAANAVKGGDPTDVAKWKSLKKKMQQLIDKAGYRPIKGMSLVDAFKGMVQTAQLQAAHERGSKLSSDLSRWRGGKLTTLQMLVKIEQAVQDRVVPVEWLHQGETEAQRLRMTSMSQVDHARKHQDNIQAEGKQVEDGDDPEEARQQREKAMKEMEQLGIVEELEGGM